MGKEEDLGFVREFAENLESSSSALVVEIDE